MKRLATITETIIKEPEITHQSADGKMIVRERDVRITVAYWFDGDGPLASDEYLSELVSSVIRHDCQWVINIFYNKNLANQAKRYNKWLEASQEILFIPANIRDELRRIKPLSKFPEYNEFTTWLAGVLFPLYTHIVKAHHHIGDQLAREIVISLVQSYYPDHEKIQKLTEDALEKAFLRLS